MEDSHEIRLPGPYQRRERSASTAPPVPHRPWSTILLVVHTLALTVGVLAMGFGVLLLAAGSRESSQGSMNLAPAFGMVFGIGGLLVGVPLGVLRRMTVVGRREAEDGRSRPIRNAAAATVVFTGIGAVYSLNFSFEPGLLLFGLYALPAVLLLQATREGATASGPQDPLRPSPSSRA